jgi:hypothetical protein
MQSFFGSAGAFQEVWVIASVGLLFAALIVLLGRRLLRRTLPPKQNPRMSDAFDQGSTSEKRAVLRRRGNATKVYIADAEKPDELSQAWWWIAP